MLTWLELQKEVPFEVWRAIVGYEEELGNRFLEKARIWLIARVAPCQATIDENDPAIRQIIINRALYEMYAYVDKEELALNRKEDAMELLRSVFGPCVDGGTDTSAKVPIGKSYQGRLSWEGFA